MTRLDVLQGHLEHRQETYGVGEWDIQVNEALEKALAVIDAAQDYRTVEKTWPKTGQLYVSRAEVARRLDAALKEMAA